MSSPSRGCGVHIHVRLKSKAGNHTAQTLTNLANIMAAHEEQIARAIKIDEGRTERYCRTVEPKFIERLKTAKPRTMDELADIWYNANGADFSRNAHYNPSRYHMLNLHACFTKGDCRVQTLSVRGTQQRQEGRYPLRTAASADRK